MAIISVFEINLLFWAPPGSIPFETIRPGIFLCTPLVYSYDNWVKKHVHIRRTCQKNVRPAVGMCVPGAKCTVNFEHWIHSISSPVKSLAFVCKQTAV